MLFPPSIRAFIGFYSILFILSLASRLPAADFWPVEPACILFVLAPLGYFAFVLPCLAPVPSLSGHTPSFLLFLCHSLVPSHSTLLHAFPVIFFYLFPFIVHTPPLSSTSIPSSLSPTVRDPPSSRLPFLFYPLPSLSISSHHPATRSLYPHARPCLHAPFAQIVNKGTRASNYPDRTYISYIHIHAPTRITSRTPLPPSITAHTYPTLSAFGSGCSADDGLFRETKNRYYS